MKRIASRFERLLADACGAAAAEMAMLTPLLILIMFGSMELGNYYLNQHALTKQVRDGARFASRMTLSEAYNCPGSVFADGTAEDKIINVTKTGSVDGSATGRFSADFWTACSGADAAVTVSTRCVDKDLYGGIYSGLDGDIPVVEVSAEVEYLSVWNQLGFDATGLCLKAESETAVAGL